MYFLFAFYVNVVPLPNFSAVRQAHVTTSFLLVIKSWLRMKSWLCIQENAVTYVLFHKREVKLSNTFGGGVFDML